MEFKSQAFTVADLYNWYRGGELILQPRFQRRKVWTGPARSYLIDTVVRGLPFPKIYFRMQVDPVKMTSVREVVDGQQRLDALFAYLRDEFRVYRHHNSVVGGKRFSDLPASLRSQILAYDVSADLLIGADDPQVLQIFARINSYAVTLNAQEKRNARFFGVFKGVAYDLGTSHLRFWIDRKILTYQSVARMAEAELTSEFMVGLLGGLQDKKSSLDRYYLLYEDQFPQEAEVRTRFVRVVGWIDRNVDLETLAFSRRALFYSLFMAVSDGLFGIEGGHGPLAQLDPVTMKRDRRERLNEELKLVSSAVRSADPPSNLAEFALASARQTDNLGPRRIRHDFLFKILERAVRA